MTLRLRCNFTSNPAVVVVYGHALTDYSWLHSQKRVPAKGGFSATFKAGAKFEKCPHEDEAWSRARDALGTLEGLTAAVGCAKGTPLPLLWAVELLPCAGSGCVVGEIDCGCIGVATSTHLIPNVAEAAIALARTSGGAE